MSGPARSRSRSPHSLARSLAVSVPKAGGLPRDHPANMQIFVKTPIGRVIRLRVVRTNTVNDVKWIIQQILGYRPERFRLVVELDEGERRLSENPICPGATLRLETV